MCRAALNAEYVGNTKGRLLFGFVSMDLVPVSQLC